MKRNNILVITLSLVFVINRASAQMPRTEEEEKKGGFKKENLFTGGSLSLGFGSGFFQGGISPFFGYSLASWVDAGIALNYNYSSNSEVYIVNPNDKIKESTYGIGGFTRIYPINMLFIQAQYEHNFITQKFIPGDNTPSSNTNVNASSVLLGAGIASGRFPNNGQPFFYLSVLFDVLDNEYSPYTDNGGGIIPIFRAGIQVPLFQGKKY
ncbi:MAG: hypothetical protein J7497_05855 [Chitinophagaceae bacterium]|nr:hypothetical protein [Chitinophagaceae bacterium]